jgi:iron complex outermembrane recepter protein
MTYKQTLRSILIGTAAVIALASGVAAQAKSIDIPAEDLNVALNAYIRQSGVQLIYNASDVAGVFSHPVHGVYAPTQALSELLGGTGIVAKSDSSGAIVVAKRADRRSENSSDLGVQVAQVSQTAPASQTIQDEVASDQGLETVTVTASRVNRAGYEAPTPTTVVSAATLEAQAQLNTSDYINDLPQMTPNTSVATTTAIGENKPNFRSLGPVRTLVLIDGNRVGYTDPLGGVDLDIMPTSLIKSIEVVSGGASADWGSDAVAGVINFHLNTNLEGIKGSFQCGESQYGDDQQCGGGIGGGASFLGGKLHAVAAVDFESNTGVMHGADNRKWATNTALLANPAYAPGNGQYQNIVVNNACYGTMSAAGIITSGPLKGTTFNSQGQPEPFIYGNYATAANPIWMQGGTCEKAFATYATSTVPPIHRQNFFTRLSYDLTDNTSIYGEFLFAHNTAENQFNGNYDPGNLSVSVNNAYLPASIKAALIANNQTSFMFGRTDNELEPDAAGTTLGTAATTVQRYIVGGKGGLWGSWTWDAHAQYQRAQYTSALIGSRNNVNWALAVDSVINPASGLPICRSTLTNPTNGCVPVDLFGAGSITPNAAAYVGGNATGTAFYTQTGAAANVQGTPIDLPAGPVSVAGGFETRTEHLNVTVDPISLLSEWRFQGLQAEQGAYTVNEGYLEAVVPILKNVSFANDLNLNIAGRVTNYSNSGTVETWKVGLNYTPFESGIVRFRGTLSVDIRAPTLNELYSKNIQSNGNTVIADPNCGNCNVSGISTFTGGNTALTPEVARTKVFGIVFSPDFLDGFTTSVDYYDIKIGNGIIALSPQQTVTDCGLGLTSACAGIVRNSSGQLTTVYGDYFNAQGLEREGVDFEATYTKPLSDWFDDVPGAVTLHSLFAYVGQNNQTAAGVLINNTGLLGNPMWHGFFSAQYNINAWQFYLQGDYVGPALNNKVNALPNPFYININHVPAVYYFNTTEQYQLTNGVQLYAGIDNLLNQNPPLFAGASASQGSGPGAGGTASFYDIIGRRFKVGARFNF